MRRISLLAGGIALALAGGLSLTGCDQVTQSAKDAATSAATGAAPGLIQSLNKDRAEGVAEPSRAMP